MGGVGWALIWVWLGGVRGGRLLTFSAFRMGAYSRWALIRGWALIRINTVSLNGKWLVISISITINYYKFRTWLIREIVQPLFNSWSLKNIVRKCFDNKLIYVCSTLKLPFETKPLSFLPVPDKCVCKQAAEDQTKGLQNKRYLYLVSEKNQRLH